MIATVDVFSLEPPEGKPLSDLEALLNAAERARAARYVRPRDAALSVAARALARLALSWRARRDGLAVAPEALVFEAGAHGKPFAAAPPAALGLVFNVSHTEGLAVCAVACAGVASVGVDVERADRRTSHLDLARRFFSEAEAAAVAEAPPGDERARLFFRLWTLKEAYVKARGVGLALPLASFGFVLGHLEPRIAFAAGADDTPAGWRFAEREEEPGHLVAVAGRGLAQDGLAFAFHPRGLPR